MPDVFRPLRLRTALPTLHQRPESPDQHTERNGPADFKHPPGPPPHRVAFWANCSSRCEWTKPELRPNPWPTPPCWTTTGLQSIRINRGDSHENSVAEQGHYRLKDAIDQTPFILRGSREFDAAGEYARLVGEMVQRRNRLVQFNLPTMGTQSVSRFTTTAHASTGCARSPGSPRAKTGRPTSSRGQALRARPDAPDPPTEAGPLGPRRFRGPWRQLPAPGRPRLPAPRAEESEVLFTLIAERYERRSLGITSNLVYSEWERLRQPHGHRRSHRPGGPPHHYPRVRRPQLPHRCGPAAGSGTEGESQSPVNRHPPTPYSSGGPRSIQDRGPRSALRRNSSARRRAPSLIASSQTESGLSTPPPELSTEDVGGGPDNGCI